MSASDELSPRRFGGPGEFRDWLAQNHDQSPGEWLQLAKKGSPLPLLTYPEALDVALGYGWIDGQVRGGDAESYLRRFSPRRPQSPWSARNRKAAEQMIAEGRMQAPGLVEVERARNDGRWDKAYEGQKAAVQHPDFLAALEGNPAAAAFYESLDSHNRYAIYFRIHEAKRAETRRTRIEKFIGMLERGEKFHD